MIASFIRGLPALAGVIIGVSLYAHYLPWWVLMAGAIAGAIGLGVGRYLLPRHPVIANLAISTWLLTGVGAMAAVAAGLLWLGQNLPSLFPQLSTEESKAAVDALTGAAATFAAMLVTKDIEEGTGVFWPAAMFRKFASAVFSHDPFASKVKANRRVEEAIFEERVSNSGPSGWGFRARHDRATIIATIL